MPFDLTTWRAEVREHVDAFARDPQGALGRAGVDTVYGFLLGSTILPVVAAYAADPHGTITALIGVLGSLGANLIANLAQRAYDENAIAVVAAEAQRAELAPTYAAVAQQLDLVALAEQSLTQAGQAATLAQLRAELRERGRTHTQNISGNAQVGVAVAGDVHGPVTQQSGGVNFGSGNTIGSIGDIVAGDKVAGDKVQGDKHVHFGAPRPDDTGPEHIQNLIDQRARRLRVLEVQAAATGYNARPEVLNEIDDLRAEIARLQALLKSGNTA